VFDPLLFPLVRTIHIAAALASGGLFALRGIAMWRGSSVGMGARIRYSSYAIDTVLLGAAVWLAILLQRTPFVDPWITAKLGLVVTYVVLGSFALKRAPTLRAKRVCFIFATIVFVAIYWFARHRYL
jgi:uncharacterized membrane protein SirB2